MKQNLDNIPFAKQSSKAQIIGSPAEYKTVSSEAGIGGKLTFTLSFVWRPARSAGLVFINFCGGECASVRCVVINLPIAWERREAVKHEFEKVGLEYEIWEAVDGTRLTDEEKRFVDNETRNRLGFQEWDNSSLACLLSHTAVLKNLVDSEDDMIAIFEDDAILHPDIIDVLAALEEQPDGFDVVKLQRSYDCFRRYFPVHRILPGHTIGRLRFHDFGCYGYVITKDAARRILGLFPVPVFEIDRIIPRYWENGLNHIYYLNPPVVFHDESLPSYIEHRRSEALATGRARRKRNPMFALRKLYSSLVSAIQRRRGFKKLRAMDRKEVVHIKW